MNKVFDLYYVRGYMDAIELKPGKLTPDAVMSNDPSIGLPLLPQIEENVEQLAKGRYQFVDKTNMHSTTRKEMIEYEKGFVDGYKAASAKTSRLQKLLESCLTLSEIKGKLLEKMIQDELQSLTPKPKQVEVEMVNDWPDGDYRHGGSPVSIPAVDEKGFVKVIRWIY